MHAAQGLCSNEHSSFGVDISGAAVLLIYIAKKTIQFGDQGPVVTLTHSSTSRSIITQVELTVNMYYSYQPAVKWG